MIISKKMDAPTMLISLAVKLHIILIFWDLKLILLEYMLPNDAREQDRLGWFLLTLVEDHMLIAFTQISSIIRSG